MAFLDNSGDIILDAVLTDTGRMRLAKGDGSFRIAKFALGDDEIDYSTYKNTNHANGAHASGSAYYDLNILQTPVLEAFTNNTSTMKSKLISISRTDLLFLPVIKLNTTAAGNNTAMHGDGVFLLASNTKSEDQLKSDSIAGVIKGIAGGGNHVRLDQGIDSSEAGSPSEVIQRIFGDLFETQYIIEMDNRFGTINSIGQSTSSRRARVSFIDDDNIASYFLSFNTDNRFVKNLPTAGPDGTGDDTVIGGPKGSMLEFEIRSSLDLQSNNFLFTQLGGTATYGGTNVYYYLDTIIRVTGATTGYRVDIPVRFVKWKSAS
mgnify:CR=1 FL=1